MGIVERRGREREEVRRKILDAARNLFMRQGYDHVTMRAVAEAIEYSPTAIYNHFKDKDDLVNSLCDEDFAKLLQVMAAHAPSPDPVEDIRRLGHAYARFGLENPNHYRFMFLTPTEGEGRVFNPAGPGKEAFAKLGEAVGRAVGAGRFRPGDPLSMAYVLWAQIHGAVGLLITLSAELWPGGASPGGQLVDDVIENGIRGFLAEGQAAR